MSHRIVLEEGTETSPLCLCILANNSKIPVDGDDIVISYGGHITTYTTTKVRWSTSVNPQGGSELYADIFVKKKL